MEYDLVEVVRNGILLFIVLGEVFFGYDVNFFIVDGDDI